MTKKPRSAEEKRERAQLFSVHPVIRAGGAIPRYLDPADVPKSGSRRRATAPADGAGTAPAADPGPEAT